ncbi:MAG: SDR family NAD(P)-dependent oxidoreductase [Christensenellales bacterium]
MQLVKDKVAIVTGAAGGIGAAIAIKLAENGAKAVYVIDMDETKAADTIKAVEKNSACHFMKTDVSSEDDVNAVYKHLKENYGRLDILINAAGITGTDSLFEMQLDRWDKIINVNTKGVLLFSRDALNMMIEQKYGRIVNIASIAGLVGGIRTNPAYSVSKAGVISLTKSFAKAGAKHNVTVNCIAPGLADTGMINTPDFVYSVEEIPMGRVATPDEVADTLLFFASDMARYVTGQCLSVDGGMYIK